MKGSLLVIAFFVMGAIVSYSGMLPAFLVERDYSQYILFVMMFLVGISIGYDKNILRTLKKTNYKIVLVPICTILGTLIGSAMMSFLLPKFSAVDCMAVGSGLGYYSLSSIFITQYKGAELGTIALMSNIIREVFVLLCAPLLATYFGKLAPITAGGACAADTLLPIITRTSGSEFVLIAIVSGLLCDLSVPILVTFLCTL